MDNPVTPARTSIKIFKQTPSTGLLNDGSQRAILSSPTRKSFCLQRGFNPRSDTPEDLIFED
jgi:hypothetical protein